MKNVIAVGIILLTMTAFCRPHHKPHGHRPAPRHYIHRPHVHRSSHIHRHHHSHHYVGPFLGALTGTIVGNILTSPTTTTVVQQPVTVVSTPAVVTPTVVIEQPQRIWVPGQYIQQVQSNGTIIKVWQPGHWTIIK